MTYVSAGLSARTFWAIRDADNRFSGWGWGERKLGETVDLRRAFRSGS